MAEPFLLRSVAAVVLVAPIAPIACSSNASSPSTGSLSGGRGLGAPCDGNHICRTGLACEGGTCQSCQCTASGHSCTINDECVPGSYCGPMRTCVAGGVGADGTACQSDGD